MVDAFRRYRRHRRRQRNVPYRLQLFAETVAQSVAVPALSVVVRTATLSHQPFASSNMTIMALGVSLSITSSISRSVMSA